MKFTIRRTYLDKGTSGKLTNDANEFICYTIERPKTGDHCCIPEGIYTASRYDSSKHGPNIWQLENVPGRTNIQFHIANWPHELLGCIAPGMIKIDGEEPGVGHSHDAFDKFMQLTSQEKFIVFTITQENPHANLPSQ